jgi:putative flippase GtrA
LDLIFKIVKFCTVGICGMSVDFGLTFFLKEKIKIDRYVSNSIGFLSGATVNFFLNRLWTFESQNSNLSHEYMLFMFFYLIGLIINNSLLYFFERKMGYNFYVSKLIAIVLTTGWNFTSNYLYNFQS